MGKVDPQSVINRIALRLANTQVALAVAETELEETRAELQAARAELDKPAPAQPAPDGT